MANQNTDRSINKQLIIVNTTPKWSFWNGKISFQIILGTHIYCAYFLAAKFLGTEIKRSKERLLEHFKCVPVLKHQ